MLQNLHKLGEKERNFSNKSSSALNCELINAVKSQDINGIQKAIEKGADINCYEKHLDNETETVFRNGVLHICAERGLTEILKILLKSGADIEQINYVGSTPLHLAASCKKEDCARELLNLAANTNAQNKIGNTPLHCAAYSGATKICSLLLKASDKPKEYLNITNSCGLTAFDYANDNATKDALMERTTIRSQTMTK